MRPPSRRRAGVALAVSLALATGGPAVQAQSAAGNPLDQLPSARPLLPPPAASPTRVDIQAPAGPDATALERRITPVRFDVEGVSAVPFAAVADLFAPFSGQPVSVARLVQVAQEATALYRASGYPLSFVYLPDQDFEGGVVRVVAVEGYIASVRVQGDAGSSEARLRAVAARLQGERPLTQAGFERITQLLTRLPGLTVQASASLPAATDGATELVLDVTRKPYDLNIGADLRQPSPRAIVTGIVNDPLLAGSQLTAATVLSKSSRDKLVSLGYSQLVGDDGLTLKATYSDYRGYPDEQLDQGAALSRYNTNRRLELSGSYPLFLSARTSLTLSGGFYAVDNVDDYREQATGGQLRDGTRVRAAFAQLSYLDAQPERSRAASILLAQGIDGLGASAQVRSNIAGLSGPGTAQLDFTRIAFDISQRDRFVNQWGTAVSFGAQYSGQSLAASERISFGGSRFGRAYAPGDAAGDSGWGAGVELNRLFRLDGTWLKQVEPFLLLEMARVSTKLGTPVPAKLGSVALGVRLSDSRYYSVDVAVAKPTGEAAATNPARRLRVSLLLSYQLSGR